MSAPDSVDGYGARRSLLHAYRGVGDESVFRPQGDGKTSRDVMLEIRVIGRNATLGGLENAANKGGEVAVMAFSRPRPDRRQRRQNC